MTGYHRQKYVAKPFDNVIVCLFAGEVPRGCVLWGVETMEFDTFIITQIVYVIGTFKSTTSNFSSVHIAHISTPSSFECLGV